MITIILTIRSRESRRADTTGSRDRLLEGSEVRLRVDFNVTPENRAYYKSHAEKTVYTGTIDSYFDYRFGALEYRSLRFETEALDEENYQGVAVMNLPIARRRIRRIIEHKHFAFGTQPGTVITKEYPADWGSREGTILSRQ